MDFLDGIEKKVKTQPKDKYKPQDYVFSDGEGPEEGDFGKDFGKGVANNAESGSD